MSLPPAIFSRHATDRIAERFKTTPENLAELMKDGLGKKIGTSAQTNLIHRLLWSHEDHCLLVAIQDIIDGTVLTVLTLEMYERDHATNLSVSRMRHVINQMVQADQAPVELWQPGDTLQFVTVHAYLLDAPRPVALGRWTGPVHSPDLSQLGGAWGFWVWVAQRVEEKQHAVEKLVRLEARFVGGRNWDVPFRTPGGT